MTSVYPRSFPGRCSRNGEYLLGHLEQDTNSFFPVSLLFLFGQCAPSTGCEPLFRSCWSHMCYFLITFSPTDEEDAHRCKFHSTVHTAVQMVLSMFE